jgi:hypothetical protein
MIDDTSLEFDMFEDARQRLVHVLVAQGRERLESEKIALYVIQGLRDMPRLITMLSEPRSHSTAKILQALGVVLDNAAALEKAKALLLGLDDTSSKHE